MSTNGRPPEPRAPGGAAIAAPPSEADTGLLCLLLLAHFYDLPVDAAQVRHQFAVPGQPFSDRELLRAAKHLGLKAGLHKVTSTELGKTPLPAMAKGRDGQYVVLAKVEGEKVLIQDPLQDGPRILAISAFEAVWTGELLLFTKRAHLRPEDLTFDVTWFIPAVVKYRRLLGDVLLASLFLRRRRAPCQ